MTNAGEPGPPEQVQLTLPLDVLRSGKDTAAGNFRFFGTYNVGALIYLIITVTVTLLPMPRRQAARKRQNYGQ